MRIFKKTVISLTSAILAVMTAIPVMVSAKWIEFDDGEFFRDFADSDRYKTYCISDSEYSKSFNSFVCMTYSKYRIDFTITSECDIDFVKDLVLSYDPDLDILEKKSDSQISFAVYDGNYSFDTLKNSREIYNKLKERYEITEFSYTGDALSGGYVYPVSSLMTYIYDPEEENRPEILRKYIEENGLDFTVADVDTEELQYPFKGKAACELLANNEMTCGEYVAAAKKIKDDLGYGTFYSSPDVGLNIQGDKVDLFGSIGGDANDDGEITIADAAAVLQSIGNPDKYKLTAQAVYNADVYEPGSGITGLDAFKIQQMITETE